MAKQKFYAYYINEATMGVVDNWPMCQEICKGQKARYKSFSSQKEAKEWLNNGGNYEEAKGKYYACYFEDSGSRKILSSWSQCQKEIKGKKARYKSFKTKIEAENWLNKGAVYQSKAEIKKSLPEGIYFDAGTGRGIGVEVRVTNVKGESILDYYLEKEKINEFGNYLCKKGSTNNFGELLGIYAALKIALIKNIFNIFGDSRLVLDYWSKGYIKENNVNSETFELAQKVKKLRMEFERLGGKIEHVSGDFNPADLGFHK